MSLRSGELAASGLVLVPLVWLAPRGGELKALPALRPGPVCPRRGSFAYSLTWGHMRSKTSVGAEPGELTAAAAKRGIILCM